MSSPQSASWIRPGPTSRPASRRTRPNVTTCRTTGSASLRLFEQAGQRLVADGFEVLVVLEHRAERLPDDLGGELLLSERGQGVRPVDRLGDAGWFRQVEPAEAADEPRRLGREAFRDSRH